MASEKSVLLISNCQSITDEPNSLTSFSGSIPFNFLKPHKPWKVALHSCAIHLNLKQKLCPKRSSYPSLIHMTYKDFSAAIKWHGIDNLQKLKIEMFHQSNKLFLDSEMSYTAKSLVQHLQDQTMLHANSGWFFGIPVKYDSELNCVRLGQFETNGEDSENRIFKMHSTENKRKQERTCVFMHENFKKGLDVQFRPNKDFKIIYVDGEVYYFFVNKPKWRRYEFFPFKSRINYKTPI